MTFDEISAAMDQATDDSVARAPAELRKLLSSEVARALFDYAFAEGYPCAVRDGGDPVNARRPMQ